MRTPVIHERDRESGRYERAFLAPTAPPADELKGFKVAKLWPAHVEEGTRIVSIEPFRSKPYRQEVPDRILGCDLVRGRSSCARVIPPEYVDELHEIDEAIAELTRRRLEVMAEAFRRGRPVTKQDVEVSS